MNRQKAINDLFASRNVLQANLEMFKKGYKDLYLPMAVELRKLVCDGKNSLLLRLFPEARLHPLMHADEYVSGAIFRMPGRMHFDGKGGVTVVKLFDTSKKPILVSTWLDQPLYSDSITIRKLIKSVADKEAAHSDPDYDVVLKSSKTFHFSTSESHIEGIAAIAEYMHAVLCNICVD